MGKIARLSADLADQIAAGEVVERPASVVKELLENALDAGATKIRVEIESGGMDLVRVSDDGEGMEREDAEACLFRHATSKIQAISDLFTIRSFGFRGEALPSIASVSRLCLLTRQAGSDEGVEVTSEGGSPIVVRPAGCAKGTSVTVRDLFWNVPVRRKFVKSPPAESAHVGDVVVTAALARPDVAVTLVRDGKIAREYLRAVHRGARAEQATAHLLGEGTLARVEADGKKGMHVEAFLAPPEKARAGATALFVYVNGRPVKDRTLTRAIAQGYGSVLEPGKVPIGVVYLDVDPETVDVNVHPQKAEVRFSDPRAVWDFLAFGLHQPLGKALGFEAAFGPWQSGGASGRMARAAAAGAPLGSEATARPVGPPPSSRREREEDDAPTRIDLPWLAAGSQTAGLGPVAGVTWLDAFVPAPGAPVEVQAPFAGPMTRGAPLRFGGLRFVGQANAMYLVCEGSDALYVLDQHAAAERVTFDRLRRSRDAEGIAMQRLLVPEPVHVSEGEAAAIESLEGEALTTGIEVRRTGSQTVTVFAVPRLLSRSAPERIVRDLLAEANREGVRPLRGSLDRVLATMACHGSLRAGEAISHEEARALLTSLDQADFAGHCPHGRPVVSRIPFRDLARDVGR